VFDYLKKVVVVGDSGCGKTSLMHQLVSNEFSKGYKATIGADFETKTILVDNKSVSLQVWDTAGQERFQSLVESFYRGADACALVFDVNVKSSFEHIEKWKNDFLEKANPINPDKFPFILIGNKIDFNERDRAVSRKIAEGFCERNGGIAYFETSAKEGTNVLKAFEEIARLCIGGEIETLNRSENFVYSEVKETNQGYCCKSG